MCRSSPNAVAQTVTPQRRKKPALSRSSGLQALASKGGRTGGEKPKGREGADGSARNPLQKQVCNRCAAHCASHSRTHDSTATRARRAAKTLQLQAHRPALRSRAAVAHSKFGTGTRRRRDQKDGRVRREFRSRATPTHRRAAPPGTENSAKPLAEEGPARATRPRESHNDPTSGKENEKKEAAGP